MLAFAGTGSDSSMDQDHRQEAADKKQGQDAMTQGMDTEEALRVVSQHYERRKALLNLSSSLLMRTILRRISKACLSSSTLQGMPRKVKAGRKAIIEIVQCNPVVYCTGTENQSASQSARGRSTRRRSVEKRSDDPLAHDSICRITALLLMCLSRSTGSAFSVSGGFVYSATHFR